MFHSALIIFAALFWLPAHAAESDVKIGRVKISCTRHEVPASQWTDKITDSKQPCKELGEGIKVAHEEYSKLMKKAGEKEAEVASKAVKSGNDTKSMIASVMEVCDSAAKEYEKAAGVAKKSADTLKEKYAKNEKAIGTMKKRLSEVTEAERERRVYLQRMKNLVRRSESDSDPQIKKRAEEAQGQIAKIEKEKEPIDKVLKDELYPRAIEEQGKAITSGRAMEKLMRQAEKENLAKKADMESKKSKLAAIKLDSGSEEANQEVAKIVSEKAPKVEADKKSLWEKLTGLTHSDPVPENIAKREDKALSELKAAAVSEAKAPPPISEEEKRDDLSQVKKSSGAAKLTEDIFDDVYQSDTVESKLAKEGALHADKVGELDINSDAHTEKQVIDVNDKLSQISVAKLKEDEEKLGGTEGVAKRVQEVTQDLKDKSKNLEELSKGLAQDVTTGTLKKLDESGPLTEKEKIFSEALKERNASVEAACDNAAVCKAVMDFGEKRTISTEDFEHKRNASIASALRGERYSLKDGSDEALAQANSSEAADLIAKRRDLHIERLEKDAVEQQGRAEGMAALREHETIMDQKTTERGINPIAGGEQAIRVESQRLITDNSVAAGILNGTTTDQKTKDELGAAFRGVEERNEVLDTLEWAPGGAMVRAGESYKAADRTAIQSGLLPESAIAETAKNDTAAKASKDTKMVAVNLMATGLTGGVAGTFTGGALEKIGMRGFAKESLSNSMEKLSARYADEVVSVSRVFPESSAHYIPEVSAPRVSESLAEKSTISAERATSPEINAFKSSADDSAESLAVRRHEEIPAQNGHQPPHVSEPVASLKTSGEDSVESAMLRNHDELPIKAEPYWENPAELEAQKQKVLKGYSEEPALAKFSPAERTQIESLRESISSKEVKLEAIMKEAVNSNVPLSKEVKRDVLNYSRQHAKEIEKIAKITGREGGEVIKLDAINAYGKASVPERYVYSMKAQPSRSSRPSGFAQHDTFLKQTPGYSVDFDPVRNIVYGTHGFEDTFDKVVSVRSASVDFSKRGADPVILHEAIHGRSVSNAEKGKSSPYDGYFKSEASALPVGPEGYRNFSSLQELPTYRMNAKDGLSAARDFAVLRKTGAPVPSALKSKLEFYGISPDSVGPHGNLTKDFDALKQYRDHSAAAESHLAAIQDRLMEERELAYALRRGENGELQAVFDAKDAYNNKIGEASIVVSRSEKDLSMLADTGLGAREGLRTEVMAKIESMRGAIARDVGEANAISEKISKSLVKANPESIFESAMKRAETASAKFAKKEYSRGLKQEGKSSVARLEAAGSSNVRAQAAITRTPIKAPPSLIQRAIGTTSNGINAAIKGVGKVVNEVIPSSIIRVRDVVAAALPSPLSEFVAASPAIKSDPLAGSIVRPDSSALASIPPSFPGPPTSSPVSSLTPSRAPSSVLSGNEGPAGNGSAPGSIPSGISGGPAAKGGGGSFGFGGTAPELNVAGKEGIASKPESDISGAPGNSAADTGGMKLASMKAGETGAGSVSEKQLLSSSGASKAGTLGKANGPATLATAKPTASKGAIAKMSLREKLRQQLAQFEKEHAAQGSAYGLAGGMAGYFATALVDTQPAPEYIGFTGVLQGSVSFLADPDTSLFMRIRHMHIKYLERQ
ncbi:MAG: hypothetical protein AB7K68_02965 [Bacteriovoracia bacterium]